MVQESITLKNKEDIGVLKQSNTMKNEIIEDQQNQITSLKSGIEQRNESQEKRFFEQGETSKNLEGRNAFYLY